MAVLGVDRFHAGEREGVPLLRRLGGEEHPPVLGDHAHGDELIDAPRGDRGGGRGEVGATRLGAPADLVPHVGEQEHGLVDVLLDHALDEADAEALLLVEGLRDGAAELAVGMPGEAGGREREDSPAEPRPRPTSACGGYHHGPSMPQAAYRNGPERRKPLLLSGRRQLPPADGPCESALEEPRQIEDQPPSPWPTATCGPDQAAGGRSPGTLIAHFS